MRPVLRVLWLLLGAAPWAMARGAALAVLVLLMGAALLGLSGWFITAAGLAGLAGIGIAFDVFRPSAGVRFLALGRTAARYGERLLTHDATLRALAALRVAILREHGRLNARALIRLRSATVLTRIVSDVDALDGLVLRLILPAGAALLTHIVVFGVLWWLVGTSVALAVLGVYLPLAVLILWRLAQRTLGPSDEAEDAGRRLRQGMIDMIRDREALILSGQLPEREERLIALDTEARAVSSVLDCAERHAGLALSVVVAIAVAGAFVAGAWLLESGTVDPAKAVIGTFVALALAETVLPLRRGFADMGRMVGAARRVAPGGAIRSDDDRPSLGGAPLLEVARDDIGFRVTKGSAIALTGPSGVGKSTLLNAIAGLEHGDGVAVSGRAPTGWNEESYRGKVALLPQRSALVAGTVRDNLLMAGPEPDNVLWAVLEAVVLADAIRARGGLDARLGEGGSGLSGGQARRLALARILLRNPELLLLDEPTEGLDPDTAAAVMSGVRRALPDAALVVALHRGADHPIFDEVQEIPAGSVTMSQSASCRIC